MLLEVTKEKTKPSSKREQFYLLVNLDKNPECMILAFENAPIPLTTSCRGNTTNALKQ